MKLLSELIKDHIYIKADDTATRLQYTGVFREFVGEFTSTVQAMFKPVNSDDYVYECIDNNQLLTQFEYFNINNTNS